MRRNVVLALCLLVGARSANAQSSERPSLKSAEDALIDVLVRHDRPGFEQLLAADAVFMVPVATRGTDAIVRAWLPFLMPNGGTVAMVANEPVVAASGDLGYVTGSMALRNPAGAVMQNVEYVAVWRFAEGHWKVAVLSGGNNAVAKPAGLGGYRFGMTPDEVRTVPDCQPYTNVSQTGGMECANYVFDGKTMNISFLFGAGRLRRIQLWFYEGKSTTDARDAVSRAIAQLRQTAGGVSVAVVPGREVTPELVMDLLRSGAAAAQGAVQFAIATPAGPQPEMWFARVARRQDAYYVMLFVDPRVAR